MKTPASYVEHADPVQKKKTRIGNMQYKYFGCPMAPTFDQISSYIHSWVQNVLRRRYSVVMEQASGRAV